MIFIIGQLPLKAHPFKPLVPLGRFDRKKINATSKQNLIPRI